MRSDMKLKFLVLCLLLSFHFLQGSATDEEIHDFIKNGACIEIEKLKHSYRMHHVLREAAKEKINTLENELNCANNRDMKIATIKHVAQSLQDPNLLPSNKHDKVIESDREFFGTILEGLGPNKCCYCVSINRSARLKDELLDIDIDTLKRQTVRYIFYMNENETEEIDSLRAQGINVQALMLEMRYQLRRSAQ